MLSKPILAKCEDRASFAKVNPVYGEPDQWMTSANLKPLGLSAISFDFFVNWGVNPRSVGDQLWVKRIAHNSVENLRRDDVLLGANACGDDLVALEGFAVRYGFTPRYMIFQDSLNWRSEPAPLLVATLANGRFENGRCCNLDQVMAAIRKYSGGPVRIGGKGLIYATSKLECYLSTTDALWPGDADCVLWSAAENRAIALLEFKKHNIETSLEAEDFQKYMHRDRRKWERLGLLRDRIEAPLFCIYYSTDPTERYIKIERFDGRFDALQASESEMVEIYGMSLDILGQTIARKVMRN